MTIKNTLSDLTKLQSKWESDLVFTQNVLGNPFTFNSTWGVFSPEKLDEGSLMLLDYIDFSVHTNSVDLGCGYGVLGMTAAKMCPHGSHTLIDKDFVAVEYARKNCQQNGLTNTHVVLSNGFSAIKQQQFDLVMSNLPAKVSKEQHYLYLLHAYAAMPLGARFYVVTINGLREFMQRSFTEVFGNSKKLKQGKTYTITMAEKLS